jgi:hypothetical protein
LAIAKRSHLTFGEGRREAPIRFELLDVIGSTLGALEWGRAQEWARNEAEKKKKNHDVRKLWAVRRANEFYKSGLSKKQVVHKLAVEEYEREKAAGKRKVRSVEAKERSFSRLIPKPPK